MEYHCQTINLIQIYNDIFNCSSNSFKFETETIASTLEMFTNVSVNISNILLKFLRSMELKHGKITSLTFFTIPFDAVFI